MKWAVSFLSSVAKDLKGISQKDKERIKQKIEWLSEQPDPRKHGKKLVGSKYKDLFRLRVGNYRIIYKTEQEQILIIITRIGHRREVYQ